MLQMVCIVGIIEAYMATKNNNIFLLTLKNAISAFELKKKIQI